MTGSRQGTATSGKPSTPSTPPALPPQRPWWRRNLIALCALVLLVPATLGATFANEWLDYFQYRPTQPIEVAAGSSARLAGTDWRIVEVRRIDGDTPEGLAAELPPGTDLVVATVAVGVDELDADGESPFCEARLEAVVDGVTRSWRDANYSSIRYRPVDGIESRCAPELTGPYRYDAIFVVPRDTPDALALRVQVPDEFPRFLRMEL